MKTIILLTALLLPIQAHATGFLLFDEFGTPPSVDWIGIYSPLSVLIGTCVDPLAVLIKAICTIPLVTFRHDDYFTAFPDNAQLRLMPLQRRWATFNALDVGAPLDPFLGHTRSGTYCVVGIDPGCAVPEPSAAWLLLASTVALISTRKFSKR